MTDPLGQQTWGNVYWGIWSISAVISFLAAEIYALVTNTANTLSDWVWRGLSVEKGQNWSALHFLVFGEWCVLVLWLTWHFFFRDFT